jgi:hypothetical protein
LAVDHPGLLAHLTEVGADALIELLTDYVPDRLETLSPNLGHDRAL